MPAEGEPALVRHAVTVPAGDAETALAYLIDVFPGGLEEERGDGVVVLAGYLPAGEAPALPAGFTAVAEPVAPGWREAWREWHRPVRVGRFWIGPPWLEPDAGADAIVIDPGAAFGTGAHGSTRAAAAVLLRQPAGGSLVDLGSGSGVLAILAARLGYAPITALELDGLAVSAAIENVAVNGGTVSVAQADVLRDPLPSVGLALANLEARLLEPLLARPELSRRVIVSGLLASEPFDHPGWVERDRELADGWLALLLERQ